MRRAWVWVLILGLAVWSPALGQEQESGSPPEEQAAAPEEEAAAQEEGAAPEEAAAGETAAEEAAATPAEGTEAAAAGELPSLAQEPPLPVVLPRPVEVEVLDLPNDNGTGLGVLWRWEGEVAETTEVMLEAQLDSSALEEYRLTDAEQQFLQAEQAQLAADLAQLTGPRDAAAQALADAEAALTLAQNNKDPQTLNLLKDKWRLEIERDKLEKSINQLRDRFLSRVRKLYDKDLHFRYLEATLAQGTWLQTSPEPLAVGDILTKADFPNRFGHSPDEADKLYTEVNQVVIYHPDFIAGTLSSEPDQYDQVAQPFLLVELTKNQLHNLRMTISEGEATAQFELGGAVSRVNFFNFSLLNNLIFAALFATIILSAIVIARRNPNLFIRRINGLEAVDEAIGRATEMGKPVLYLTGMDALSSLSTLAAVNILGRVARKIADYDSDLVVPCRDPVTLTVAQEVVREAYTDVGRPDAYRQDNIFFLTDDQFAFTAATCAIIVRDRPAANFFMGYYYAESLLLAETGASTGAIQIAGTDATHQLPFFIVTCDYTLIGEELYAASAYLSREPMLLGSLKGQDLGKAMVMILIVLQTALFVLQTIPSLRDAGLDFFKNLVVPL